jgi:hypothetical protein
VVGGGVSKKACETLPVRGSKTVAELHIKEHIPRGGSGAQFMYTPQPGVLVCMGCYEIVNKALVCKVVSTMGQETVTQGSV